MAPLAPVSHGAARRVCNDPGRVRQPSLQDCRRSPGPVRKFRPNQTGPVPPEVNVLARRRRVKLSLQAQDVEFWLSGVALRVYVKPLT